MVLLPIIAQVYMEKQRYFLKVFEIHLAKGERGVKKADIAKGMVAFVLAAVIFATGLYFGRTGAQGGFTVTTQYNVGAMSAYELEEIAERVAARAGRDAADRAGQTPAENQPPAQGGANAALININTATAQELTALPGVGPGIAERIIAHREAHGPFRIIEEITDVSGIGERRFEDIRELITVGNN